jgi:hypothetical protein
MIGTFERVCAPLAIFGNVVGSAGFLGLERVGRLNAAGIPVCTLTRSNAMAGAPRAS